MHFRSLMSKFLSMIVIGLTSTHVASRFQLLTASPIAVNSCERQTQGCCDLGAHDDADIVSRCKAAQVKLMRILMIITAQLNVKHDYVISVFLQVQLIDRSWIGRQQVAQQRRVASHQC